MPHGVRNMKDHFNSIGLKARPIPAGFGASRAALVIGVITGAPYELFRASSLRAPLRVGASVSVLKHVGSEGDLFTGQDIDRGGVMSQRSAGDRINLNPFRRGKALWLTRITELVGIGRDTPENKEGEDDPDFYLFHPTLLTKETYSQFERSKEVRTG